MFTSGNEYDILGAERVEQGMADWHTDNNARRGRERKPQRATTLESRLSLRPLLWLFCSAGKVRNWGGLVGLAGRRWQATRIGSRSFFPYVLLNVTVNGSLFIFRLSCWEGP